MTNVAISDPLQKGGDKQEPVKVTPVKEKNYTQAQEDILKAEYPLNPTRETVNELAKRLGKGQRSVIAKLSSMKIYVTPARTTKSGTPIVKKETLVICIGKHLENTYPSLVKANKADLERLLADLTDHFGDLDDELVA